MTAYFGRTADEAAAVIGPWATAAEAYGLLTVTVPARHWTAALTAARDGLGCGFFDWLSAVDELADGFDVYVHVAAVPPSTPGTPAAPAAPDAQADGGPAGRGDATAGGVRRLLIRTRVARDAAALPTAVGVWAGASWHERETREMFGIDFTGHPDPAPLLLPDGFEGHPLRKEFVLAARVAKAWPGAKEPGESEHAAGGRRRKMLPPGVPDPNTWGPEAGTLPPEPDRPSRAGGGGAPAAGERRRRADRPRRTRSASGGSASQQRPPAPGETPGDGSAPGDASAPGPDTGPGPTPGGSAPGGPGEASAPGSGAGPDTASGPGSGDRPPRRPGSAPEGPGDAREGER